jgi:2,3,4,5-tetrahydropyridine-2-carboxylate N-succinyltransferase
MSDLAETIEEAWDARETLSSSTHGPIRQAVEEALELLDSGKARVAE